MLIGYNIGGDFNDSYMFDSNDIYMPICEKCGYVTNYDYISPNFELNKEIYDISYTYDGRVIVSLRFKEFCLRNNYTDIEFHKLPKNLNHFVFKLNNLVEFDTKKRSRNYRSTAAYISGVCVGSTGNRRL